MATQGDYERLFASTRAEMHDLADRLASGALSVDDWGDEVYGLLAESHAEAYALGRQRAGRAGLRSADDDFLGRGIADNEVDYLGNFLDDLEGDRYLDAEGNLKADVLKSRLDLYCHRLRGTANEAFVEESPSISVFRWRLGIVEHCEDCLTMEAQNPYTQTTMYRHPADGSCDCKTNCHCYLQRQDGVEGFKRAPTTTD
ncbi:MAG: hypothetical protein EOP06_00470 [Proteobacteria bacterium]|nr:MAG: hypothetical protein EOP06_00470 [Pseudomonadota bacterium]